MRDVCAVPKFGSCQGSLLELCGAFRSVGLRVSFQAAPAVAVVHMEGFLLLLVDGTETTRRRSLLPPIIS